MGTVHTVQYIPQKFSRRSSPFSPAQGEVPVQRRSGEAGRLEGAVFGPTPIPGLELGYLFFLALDMVLVTAASPLPRTLG